MMKARTIHCLAAAAIALVGSAWAAPLDEAERLIGAGDFEGARRNLEPIVAANPYDGMAAYYLGVSLARTGHCDAALPILDAALAAGVNGARSGMRSANLRAAECLASRGDAQGAAARVREAWAHWSASDVEALTRAEVFAPVRASGVLAPFTGRTALADAGGAVEKMRADLAFFDQLVRQAHPNPFHRINEPAWRTAVSDVDARAGSLSQRAFNTELMRLAAMVGDGHTSVFPLTEGPDAFSLLPIYPMWMADGWMIVAAAPAHRDLVGARIEGVGGRPIADIFPQLDAFVPGDNEITGLWLGGVVMQTYDAFETLGLASDGGVVFDVVLSSGERRAVRLERGAIDRDPNARGAPSEWARVGQNTLWLRDPSAPFAMQWLAQERVLYVQVNQVRDADGQTLAQFGEAVLAELRRRRALGAIVDVRHNNGGDVSLAYGFTRALDRYEPLQREGALVVLTGPRSYSATMDFTNRLQRDMGAVVVGWPTGGRPNVYSTERPFTLPYSRITGTISARWHQDGLSGDDMRPWIAPDIAVWPTGADLLAGRDPVLQAALASLREAQD
jgi:hypothetical protein